MNEEVITQRQTIYRERGQPKITIDAGLASGGDVPAISIMVGHSWDSSKRHEIGVMPYAHVIFLTPQETVEFCSKLLLVAQRAQGEPKS